MPHRQITGKEESRHTETGVISRRERTAERVSALPFQYHPQPEGRQRQGQPPEGRSAGTYMAETDEDGGKSDANRAATQGKQCDTSTAALSERKRTFGGRHKQEYAEEEDSLSLSLVHAQPQPLTVVLVRQHVITPVTVVEIPADRLHESLVKVIGGRPPQFGLDLGRIDGIAPIVPRPVRDEPLEGLVTRNPLPDQDWVRRCWKYLLQKSTDAI